MNAVLQISNALGVESGGAIAANVGQTMPAKSSKNDAKRKEGERWLELRRQIESWLRNPKGKPINVGSASKRVLIAPPRPSELGADFDTVVDSALDLSLEKTINPVVAAGRKFADWQRSKGRQRARVEAKRDDIEHATMAQESSGQCYVRHTDERLLRQATIVYCEERYREITGRDWDPDADWVGGFKSGLLRKDYELEQRSRAALVKLRSALAQLRESITEVRSIATEVRSGPIALPVAEGSDGYINTWRDEEANGGAVTNNLVRVVDPMTRRSVPLNWFVDDFPLDNTLSDLMKVIPPDVETLRIDRASLELDREHLAYFWPSQKALMAEISAMARGDEDAARRADTELGAPHPAREIELATVWILLGGWPKKLKLPEEGMLPSEVVKSAAKGFEKSNEEVGQIVDNYERELKK